MCNRKGADDNGHMAEEPRAWKARTRGSEAEVDGVIRPSTVTGLSCGVGCARGERGDGFRRIRDRVTCPWVAPFPCLALTEPEASKAPQFYGLSRLQRRHNVLQELRQHRVDLSLWKLHSFCDLVHEICLG